MRAQKTRTEVVVYSVVTILTAIGTALCLAGLLLPYWYNAPVLEGDVVVGEARLGLWHDEVCWHNLTCESHWLSDSSYTRPGNMSFPFWKLIQAVETAGSATAVFSLLVLLPLWLCQRTNTRRFRILPFSVFFVSSLIAGFLCIIGCLIVSSKVDSDNVDFAPLLSGIGGSVIFISVCLACVVCRYDPTYGTLENPVSPRFTRA